MLIRDSTDSKVLLSHLNDVVLWVGRMTLLEIEKRVKSLEQKLQQLGKSNPGISRNWYRTHAGRFAGDRVFDKIVRLGRAYRIGRGNGARRPTKTSVSKSRSQF
jgi:hypothetical protein